MWYTFFAQHSLAISISGVYVFVAMVKALPDPTKDKFEFYPWAFHVLNMLMNNVPAQYQPKPITPNQ